MQSCLYFQPYRPPKMPSSAGDISRPSRRLIRSCKGCRFIPSPTAITSQSTYSSYSGSFDTYYTVQENVSSEEPTQRPPPNPPLPRSKKVVSQNATVQEEEVHQFYPLLRSFSSKDDEMIVLGSTIVYDDAVSMNDDSDRLYSGSFHQVTYDKLMHLISVTCPSRASPDSTDNVVTATARQEVEEGPFLEHVSQLLEQQSQQEVVSERPEALVLVNPFNQNSQTLTITEDECSIERPQLGRGMESPRTEGQSQYHECTVIDNREMPPNLVTPKKERPPEVTKPAADEEEIVFQMQINVPSDRSTKKCEKSPQALQIPHVSQKPHASQTPHVFHTPHVSQTLHASQTPHVSQTPRASQTPHASLTLHASQAPSHTQTKRRHHEDNSDTLHMFNLSPISRPRSVTRYKRPVVNRSQRPGISQAFVNALLQTRASYRRGNAAFGRKVRMGAFN